MKRQADHARFDSMVRARAIREDLQAGARPGAYLYQAHLAADLERRVIDGHDLTRESLDILRSIESRLERIEARQQAIENRQQAIEERLRVLKHLRTRAARCVPWRSVPWFVAVLRLVRQRLGRQIRRAHSHDREQSFFYSTARY